MSTKKIDPRTKIVMTIIGILVTYLSKSIKTEMFFVFLFIIVISIDDKRRSLRYLITYSSQLIIFFYILPLVNNRSLYYMLSFYGHGLRLLQPTFIPALYTLTGTPTREWVYLLKKIKAPNSLITAVAVMGRFYPVVKQDYIKIKQAMSFRGLGSGFLDYIKHPFKTFEYIIVPVLMQASQLADDLTISALTKGMGLDVAKTSYVELRISALDYFIIFFFIGLFGLFFVKGWL